MSPSLPALYAIVDVEVCDRAGRAPADVARAYLAGGARLLQLRAKGLAGGAFLDLAAELVDEARQADARVIVNDRADLAALSRAAGVHLGQDDLGAADARRIVGPGALLGVSTHTVDQIVRALSEPISYLAIGPVFSTTTKATGYDAVGLGMVGDASRRAAACDLPVVAIGGITLATARSVRDAGAASVAIITDLLAGDPERQVRQYLAVLA